MRQVWERIPKKHICTAFLHSYHRAELRYSKILPENAPAQISTRIINVKSSSRSQSLPSNCKWTAEKVIVSTYYAHLDPLLFIKHFFLIHLVIRHLLKQKYIFLESCYHQLPFKEKFFSFRHSKILDLHRSEYWIACVAQQDRELFSESENKIKVERRMTKNDKV